MVRLKVRAPAAWSPKFTLSAFSFFKSWSESCKSFRWNLIFDRIAFSFLKKQKSLKRRPYLEKHSFIPIGFFVICNQVHFAKFRNTSVAKIIILCIRGYGKSRNYAVYVPLNVLLSFYKYGTQKLCVFLRIGQRRIAQIWILNAGGITNNIRFSLPKFRIFNTGEMNLVAF